MKDKLKLKFKNHKHKWIWFHVDSVVFNDVIDCFTKNITQKNITSKSAKSLTKCFKFHEKVFIKYIKTVGRKNFNCLCHIIDKDNNKLEILLSPNHIIDANILSGTPKSLKLYRTDEKDKNNWTKPDDGFIDPISYPPVEEELTELGYAMYKDWTEEVAASGLSSTDYYRKLCGTLKYYKKAKNGSMH